jgi:predicted glycosyltransferase
MDYEFQPANHISFRLAHLVIVPSAIPEDMLQRQGAMARRTFQYDGLKEEVYLEDYRPDPEFFGRLKGAAREAGKSLEPEHVLLVLRPPATMAAYHRFDNPLFIELLHHLGRFAHARQIVLPRTPMQRMEIESHLPENAFIPEKTFDGRHLVYAADGVVSAGGTMNREAAVLGTPVYSIFAGRLGAVDRRLIEEGRMVLVRKPEDFEQILVEKKPPAPREFDFNLRSLLIEKCLELAYVQQRKRARS